MTFSPWDFGSGGFSIYVHTIGENPMRMTLFIDEDGTKQRICPDSLKAILTNAGWKQTATGWQKPAAWSFVDQFNLEAEVYYTRLQDDHTAHYYGWHNRRTTTDDGKAFESTTGLWVNA